mmetsp:Transcript_19219/g.20657  ORF Transcript_19219/g.20657 Transcript_19219/m.20657 type:complete len:534 (-) Transcript_19219:72-1673(-)
MSSKRGSRRGSMSALLNSRTSAEQRDAFLPIFQVIDTDGNGVLDRAEVSAGISLIVDMELDSNQVQILFDEFDKDENGEFDLQEFSVMANYFQTAMSLSAPSTNDDDEYADEWQYQYDPSIKGLKKVYGLTQHQSIIDKRKEENHDKMAELLDYTIDKSKRNRDNIVRNIATELYPVRDILCLQNVAGSTGCLDYEQLFEDQEETVPSELNPLDHDFESAFPASDMRCLALVSHNGMKKTMRTFVVANKNLLKKFRLTGTNSTMTMLKEVFQDEPAGSVIYGPRCASGPLGGDAELVTLMVAGRIGGILFFQDPMNAHPHRADIDCLVRQALVHNTMLAENPTSAYMLVSCLRTALSENKAALIPSFFFQLESPTVVAYKNQQSSVVNSYSAGSLTLLTDVIEKPSSSSRKAKVITFIREVESEGDDLACSLSESMLKDCTNGNDVFCLVTDENAIEIDDEGVFAFDEDLHAKINTTKTHEMIFNFNKQKFRQSYFFNLPISDILNGEDHTVIIYVTTKKKRSTTRRLQFNKS